MSVQLATLRHCGPLRRVDVALGEWFARAFPGAAPEIALAAALAARAIADGHSALALAEAQAWLDGLAGSPSTPRLPDPATWRATLAAPPAVHVHAAGAPAALRPLVLDAQDRVHLRRYFEYERGLAAALIARATLADDAQPRPAVIPAAGVDPGQRRAVDVALAKRFALVTGGPGTGKTHGVVRMLAALSTRAAEEGAPLRIALAAPTGKAAARLAESVRAQLARLGLADAVAARIPRDASTLHRLLGISPWQAQPRHHHAAPLPFDVVVVDEVSMVDLPLMAKLVDAVPPAARLILLGDPDQLSAVEAGNVLGALVEATTTPPLKDCHVALAHSHRFDEHSPLGRLANAIARQDAQAALEACHADPDATLADDAGIAHLVAHAAEAYRSVSAAVDAAAALVAARRFRVLTALRRGPTGCTELDAAIAARLQRALGQRADTRWWRGRLLTITANRPDLGLFNGDTCVIWPDADGALQAWFESADTTPRALPLAALPPHEGAFALTVHKAQGSEFERVALVTGPDSAVLTRELLYTGVTRARSGITLYTTPEVLRAGIGRRTLRMTGLADRLREAAGT